MEELFASFEEKAALAAPNDQLPKHFRQMAYIMSGLLLSPNDKIEALTKLAELRDTVLPMARDV